MGNRIRLMTHNVWWADDNKPAWEKRGEDCSAVARLPGLLRVYRETEPDVIGGQEVSPLMERLLDEGLKAEGRCYALIPGHCTPILYRADKLELLESEFFSYPEQIPGFEGPFNDAGSKSYHLGVFRVRESGKRFIFVTTHLWWMRSPSNRVDSSVAQYRLGSDEAREYQIQTAANAIRRFREKYGCPAILVGDMNCEYDSAAMTFVRSLGFCHAHDIATEYAEEAVGYHYCFADGYETRYYDRPFKSAIDHIYVIGEEKGAVKRFERYSPEYYYPISDHSAAYIDMDL